MSRANPCREVHGDAHAGHHRRAGRRLGGEREMVSKQQQCEMESVFASFHTLNAALRGVVGGQGFQFFHGGRNRRGAGERV